MRRLYVLIALLLAASMVAPTVAAQDASPGASPVAGDCVAPEIPAGTPTPMEEEASPAAGDALEATPEGEVEIVPEASPEIPQGEPAPDDVAADVEAAVQNFAACYNAGEYEKVAALHTPAGLLEECGTANPYDGPACFGGTPPVSNVVVGDVQVHGDGRVSADVTAQVGSFLIHERFFFVRGDDGTYLVDATPDLPVAVPVGATVVAGELADYAFVLSETSAPAGDIAFTVTNTGEYPHELVVLKLPEGVTVEALFEDESLFEQVEFLGFTFAEPGQDASPLVMVDVEPGTYTLVCFVDVPEGIPHVMRGMVLEFEVTAA
jgi:hypothetical protein